MGTYTDFWATLWLKPLPPEVEQILQYLVYGGEEWEGPLPDHPFFECERWFFVCANVNWGPRLSYRDGELLSVEAHFKNYDDEIDKFLDWLSPWIDEGWTSLKLEHWYWERRYRHFPGKFPVRVKFACNPRAEERGWGAYERDAYCGESGHCTVALRFLEDEEEEEEALEDDDDEDPNLFPCPHCGTNLEQGTQFSVPPLIQLAQQAE